jgi:hypothetical protein
MARAPEEEGSMGSVDAITVLVYPASEALLQCRIQFEYVQLGADGFPAVLDPADYMV